MKQHLCNCNDLSPGESRGFSIEQADGSRLDLFVVKQDDRFYAYENVCPHAGSPLDWVPDQFLDINGEYIQCATHNALFSIEKGECVSGPCNGQGLRSLKIMAENDQLYLLQD